ncbi:peptidoglycan DD-metalloendopeptidase family protein [Gloeobacter kilaueensis]|uniref:Peptidase M23 n=1 Tax=Gloeobacter kilaueensis (strain ATCC BAA-2537 / CCAP 1431/1 / ULC 316 / JS1) TaxID=1183438 RepID=U5QM50_GLOK1|nr:M23 family metallopeptidase [Gloeobacter kilaueensis]AGY59991.1 peptidase M23 [Gloeobacter kilaueensis JS1]
MPVAHQVGEYMVKSAVQTVSQAKTPLPSRIARRKFRIGWYTAAAVALVSGAIVVARLSAPIEPVADANLVAVLQQNTQAKYVAALVVVSDSEHWLDGRRSVVTHTVAADDTLDTLARSYGLRPSSIALSNSLDLTQPLAVGHRLLIPPVDGLVYRVEGRDTLAAIAERFAVPATAIAKATGPSLQDFISPGQLLVIPGEATALTRRADGASVSAAPAATLAALSLVRPSHPTNGHGYTWPVQGYVGSPYGWRGGRMHEGIDIVGPMGSPVVAARTGVVVYAGWMSGGFGNAVDIRHEDGIVSRYAHLSRVTAQPGQSIEAGQTLGARGCTGRCTGPHLHFEIHQGGRAVNPLPFLR